MALSELDGEFSGPRSALELSPPEQIVVWSLRRYKARDAQLEALAGSYRRIFDLAEVEPALAAAVAESELPSVIRTGDLTADETLLLQAVRIWVACAKENRCGGPDLMEHLAAHGAGNASPSLHGILYNSSAAATRGIDVRCRRCPNLSPDEARLLHMIACGQRRLAARACALLAAWLPAPAVRLTIDAVVCAGRELHASGVALPWRAWDFAALERLALPPPSGGGSETRVLH